MLPSYHVAISPESSGELGLQELGELSKISSEKFQAITVVEQLLAFEALLTFALVVDG